MEKSSQRISLYTEQSSLYSLHEQVFSSLSTQSEELQSLVRQLIDYYHKIILAMPGNVYWLDRDCRAIGCNQNVLDMFGLEKQDQFYGLSFEEMAGIGGWTENQGASFKHDTEVVIDSGEAVRDVEEPPIPGPDGSTTYFLTTRKPLFNANGEVIGVVGISTDITSRKQMEFALAEAKHSAEKLASAQTEFIANMSHDIRTPLSSLVALNAHLLEHLRKDPLESFAKDAYDSAKQLGALMDEILEIAELDLGRISDKVATFSLPELGRSIIALLEQSAKQKSLSLDLVLSDDLGEYFVGKRELLQRILLNLVSNAVKFTHKGGVKVSISRDREKPAESRVLIEVSDTGIGIPAEEKERIFDRFSRLTAATEGEYPGRGLGLYMVKKFADILNAKLSVDSVEGQGTTFSLSLSLSAASEEQINHVKQSAPLSSVLKKVSSGQRASSPPVGVESQSLAKEAVRTVKILLVEDTPIVQRVAQATLGQALPCNVDLATRGEEAIDFASRGHYDFVLMDLGLPDMTGMEAAKRIRQLEVESGRTPVPIVALTAHLAVSDRHDCLQSGIQQILHKPLSVEQARALAASWACSPV